MLLQHVLDHELATQQPGRVVGNPAQPLIQRHLLLGLLLGTDGIRGGHVFAIRSVGAWGLLSLLRLLSARCLRRRLCRSCRIGLLRLELPTLRGCARIRGAGRLILIGLLGRLARLLSRLPLLALLTGLPSRLLLLALLTLLTWLTLLALLILLSGLRLSLLILLSLLSLLTLLAWLTLLSLLALLSRLALVLILLRPQLRGDKITIMQGVPMQT